MRKWCILGSFVAAIKLGAVPALAQRADVDPATNGETCGRAMGAYALGVQDYLDAKFALDRAIQLLASARYSSIVGKMKINVARQESDLAHALPRYVATLGPAYAAIASMDTNCSINAITPPRRLPSTARFKQRLDGDLSLLLRSGVDRLADDQMADTKKMFDDRNKK